MSSSLTALRPTNNNNNNQSSFTPQKLTHILS